MSVPARSGLLTAPCCCNDMGDVRSNCIDVARREWVRGHDPCCVNYMPLAVPLSRLKRNTLRNSPSRLGEFVLAYRSVNETLCRDNGLTHFCVKKGLVDVLLDEVQPTASALFFCRALASKEAETVRERNCTSPVNKVHDSLIPKKGQSGKSFVISSMNLTANRRPILFSPGLGWSARNSLVYKALDVPESSLGPVEAFGFSCAILCHFAIGGPKSVLIAHFFHLPKCNNNSCRRSSCILASPPQSCKYSVKSLTPKMWRSRKPLNSSKSRSTSSHLRMCSSSEKYS